MIAETIPGYGAVRIEHLVLDYNGTLAVDGRLLYFRHTGEFGSLCVMGNRILCY